MRKTTKDTHGEPGLRALRIIDAVTPLPQRFEILRCDGLTVVERPAVRKWWVQMPPWRGSDLPAMAAGQQAGAKPPATPNTASNTNPALLWMSPGEWLAYEAPDAVAGADELTPAGLAEDGYLVTDASCNFTLLELSGPRTAAVLALDSGLDIERDLPPGACAQTCIAQMRVILHTPAAAVALDSVFRLFIDRSVASSMRRWLKRCALAAT